VDGATDKRRWRWRLRRRPPLTSVGGSKPARLDGSSKFRHNSWILMRSQAYCEAVPQFHVALIGGMQPEVFFA
jgi:hypothetical protein